MIKDNTYDIAIVGGGLVGVSLAVALQDLPYRVVVIDAYPFGAEKQPAYDDRAIALSYGSSQILKGVGVWDQVESGSTAIDMIHVSDRGHFGATRLSAKQENVPALGYLVESRVLGTHLHEALSQSKHKYLAPKKVTSLQTTAEGISLQLGDETLNCKLLVAADGGNSTIRQLMRGGIDKHDYQQSAIVANVTPQKPHKNIAYERFTAKGPIALLPMTNDRCSLVWTLPKEEIETIMALDSDAFLQALQKAFGYRLGRFLKVGKRSTFPLALIKSPQVTASHTVFIGNAAQALHPVAGQGLNLGLRDVAQLVEILAKKEHTLGSVEQLNSYQQARQADRETVIRYTHTLISLFCNDSFFLGHLRASGLILFDRIAPLRRLLSRQSMGARFGHTRLARGLPPI